MATYNAAAVADAAISHKKGISLQTGRALRDNPIAISEGASGAPRNLAASLNTATSSVTGTLASGGLVRINLNDYSFFPDIKQGSDGIEVAVTLGTAAATTPGFGLFNTAGADRTYSVAWRYIY